jgi:CheY-like chemotaxis protein
MAAVKQLRVVAVDDDALVLLNTVAMLEELGHKVYEAYSAPEALKIIRANEVDLVITDYSMPGTSGAQLATMIHSERPDLPIILATGYAELPEGSKSDLPRLAKPFTQDDLARVVSAAMAMTVPA